SPIDRSATRKRYCARKDERFSREELQMIRGIVSATRLVEQATCNADARTASNDPVVRVRPAHRRGLCFSELCCDVGRIGLSLFLRRFINIRPNSEITHT